MYSASRSLTRKDIHIHRPSGKALIRKPQLIRRWFQSLPQSTRRLLSQLAKDGDFSFVDMISSLLLAETSSNNIEDHIFEVSDPEKTESRLSEMRFAISPWDSHSWEAKEWFLRKWNWLIGGQDGELWHSSRWWAAQRGEYISMRD
ncbi:hypothetical protein TsFJ059_000687 [Trichoderma semiorbis]|uniref:Uncharacterized protein n=1 Tax=Trichoderma semiorbis TaxID=1491008 RepID=A0A9P8HMG1_9HYPO|nr:hypothetical protein TsFJ059_000687 [Trichoderma semiorbis]